jgi:hypothetical protein
MQALPTTKTFRSTTQGFGKRYDILPLQGRGSPSPDTYNIKTCFDINIKTKKGIKIQEKVEPLVKINFTNFYSQTQLPNIRDLENTMLQSNYGRRICL